MVSIKFVRLARCGIAKSMSSAFDVMTVKGSAEVVKEVGHYDEIYRRVKELEKQEWLID